METVDFDRRQCEEDQLRTILAAIRSLRVETSSPMVDINLARMEEVCLHTLTFFSADVDLNPYQSRP